MNLITPLGRGLAALALSLSALAVQAAAPTSDIDIPYTEFTLDNGLTVIVHEDRKAPIVAVNVWYHVGSKNEPEGKTGFAHLFEHLMFNGTENYDGEYFVPFQKVGATDQNGTTNFDRTNYFQNVPSTALDLALWMESDRMGHLLGAVDQDKLDEQRGVVQNEKRQGENQPYGQVFTHIFRNLFPEGHPYQWLPIGSMEDLNAASLEDVQEWFKTYYGPNNAVIVIAGDVTPEVAREKAEKYFGDIPPGPPIAKFEAWSPKREADSREVMQDRVPQARIYKNWVGPHWSHPDAELLSLAGSVLSSGKTSRLYKRLVYDEQIATSVDATPYFAEIAGVVGLEATAQPGDDLAAIEKALDEELARFLQEGPTRDELERAKTRYIAGFVRGIERIGGFGGKSDILAQNAVYAGDPDFYKVSLARIEEATPKAVMEAARRWYDAGSYTLEVHPFPEFAASGEGADRSDGPPMPAEFPSVAFEAFERATLDNGMELIVAGRDAVPVVNFTLMLDAGYASDQFGEPGTSNLAMSMLDEGTKRRDALEISEELLRLGANLGAGSNLDMSTVSLNALTANLDESLDIYADVILNPSFPEADLARLKKQFRAQIQREKVTPVSMALRVFPELMYGEGHAYSLPLTGSGTLESLERIDRRTLVDYHRTWFRPNNATMIVVGDTTMESIRPKLEKLFRDWEPGSVPVKNVDEVAQQPEEKIYLLDRPDAEQSIIFAGHIMPPKANPDEFAIDAMNNVLGGDFSARLNMNLREDKSWSYGARTLVLDAAGPRPFLGYAPVQTDKTAPAMAEMRREMVEIVGERPPTEDELARVLDDNTLSLPGRWETAGAVAGSLVEMVRFRYDDDYWDTYAENVRGLSLQQVSEAANEYVRPDNLIWVIVGDRAKIESEIRALEIGEIVPIDADGNVLTDEGT